MKIKGLVKTSLIDYPGKVAYLLFTGGCNFRCPFCQNTQLVLHPETLPDVSAEEVLSSLARRRGFIDGVVISGGEPTLQPDLSDFVSRVKELELAVKLDTNGYRPDTLKELITSGLVDYVAMDVKATPSKYPQAAGVPLDFRLIEQSIALLLSSAIEYEFRTTVVPGIVTPQDVDELATLLAGAKRYALQQFQPDGVLDAAWRKVIPYPAQTLLAMAEQLQARGIPTETRGI